MRKVLMTVMLGAALALSACGGGAAPADGAGDAGRGKALYEQAIIGSASAPGCRTCHTLDGTALVGPSFQGIATRAPEELASPKYTGAATTVEDYFRESIVQPNVFIAEGYAEGAMYQTYGAELSEQEIKDLVAYLLTLQ